VEESEEMGDGPSQSASIPVQQALVSRRTYQHDIGAEALPSERHQVLHVLSIEQEGAARDMPVVPTSPHGSKSKGHAAPEPHLPVRGHAADVPVAANAFMGEDRQHRVRDWGPCTRPCHWLTHLPNSFSICTMTTLPPLE